VSYQREEERYWTDYLRIALPVVGLLLLLGLFWFWANSLINNGDGNNGVSGAAATQTAEAAVVINTAPVPTATAPAPATIAATETTQVAANSNASGTATRTTQTGQTQTQQQTQSEPTATTAAASSSGNQASSGGTFQEGDKVLVTDNQVNLRSSPSAVDNSNIVTQVNEGDELVITGPSEESENYTWWPVQVSATGDNGYIVEQFIKKEGS
jgi:cytoskeletal protein RodZ